MDIDRNAPMVVEEEIVIDAPVEVVWNLETDINNWPTWQPGVTAARLDGELAPGSVFRWKAQGLGIVSTLQDVDIPRRIGWTGKATGINAIHVWTFEPVDGKTRVVSAESWSGWLVRLFKLLDRRMLEKSVKESLQTLKEKSEG